MPVPARANLVTLGVADVAAATAFYRRLGWRPSSASTADVSFFDLNGVVLALFGRADLAADAGVPDGPTAFRGVALAINLGSPEEVDATFADAVAAGAVLVKAGQRTEWGGYSGYFADPDSHLWEVAHNPFWPLDQSGRVVLPR